MIVIGFDGTPKKIRFLILFVVWSFSSRLVSLELESVQSDFTYIPRLPNFRRPKFKVANWIRCSLLPHCFLGPPLPSNVPHLKSYSRPCGRLNLISSPSSPSPTFVCPLSSVIRYRLQYRRNSLCLTDIHSFILFSVKLSDNLNP